MLNTWRVRALPAPAACHQVYLIKCMQHAVCVYEIQHRVYILLGLI